MIWLQAANASINPGVEQSPSGDPKTVTGFPFLRLEAADWVEEASVPKGVHIALSSQEQRAGDPRGHLLLLEAFLFTYLELTYLKIVAAKECR